MSWPPSTGTPKRGGMFWCGFLTRKLSGCFYSLAEIIHRIQSNLSSIWKFWFHLLTFTLISTCFEHSQRLFRRLGYLFEQLKFFILLVVDFKHKIRSRSWNVCHYFPVCGPNHNKSHLSATIVEELWLCMAFWAIYVHFELMSMLIGAKCVRINCGLVVGGRQSEGWTVLGNSCSRGRIMHRFRQNKWWNCPKRPVPTLKASVHHCLRKNDPTAVAFSAL